MSTVLRDSEPSGFHIDPETNMVVWTWPSADGASRREAMHYPLFCRTIFICLDFIQQTNEARERAIIAARDESRGRIIPLRQGVERGDDHAASP